MFSKYKSLSVMVAIISAINISACSNSKNKELTANGDAKYITEAAAKLYADGNELLKNNDLEVAVQKYERLVVDYPFGDISEDARVKLIYIYDRLERTEAAEAGANRFIKNFPLHKNIDYIYYLRGVIQFEKKRSKIQKRLGGATEVHRNKTRMEKSYNAFQQFIIKFPNSKFIDDAKLRMKFLRTKMAKQELIVAQFYARRNANVSVINRCKYILENFPESPAVINAMNLMANTYDKMELPDLAKQTRDILEFNYKGIKGADESTEKNNAGLWDKFKGVDLNPFN